MTRALSFIAESARNPGNFAVEGGDYMYCFYSLSNTASDAKLRRAAIELGIQSAEKWTKTHADLPANASAYVVFDYVSGWLTASLLGQNDRHIRPRLRRAAARYNAMDYLLFDPRKEPPPSDIPENCAFDGTMNSRGTKLCVKCGRPLVMRTKYSIWLDALLTTYTGDRYGIPLGGPYKDVVQWAPAMRPYLDLEQTSYGVFIDTVYSMTHLVYTLNDYGQWLLPRDLLPQEYSYLRRNLKGAIALKDPETMGEFLDSLKSFGLDNSDPVMQTGITYLLETQQPNGTWTPAENKDPYTQYHSAWTGIDGLKQVRWRGKGLSFPDVRAVLLRVR